MSGVLTQGDVDYLNERFTLTGNISMMRKVIAGSDLAVPFRPGAMTNAELRLLQDKTIVEYNNAIKEKLEREQQPSKQ